MGSKLIKQHNAISMASYDMSATEKNILYLLMAEIKDDKPKKIYKIFVKNIKSSTGKNILHSRLKGATNSLVDKILKVSLKDKGYIRVNLFMSAEYWKGKIELELSEEMHEFFFHLKNNFTTFQLESALMLRSKYSKRIYEMLSQYKDTKNMHISIDDFKERFCLTGKYSEFGLLKKYVLEVARKEIGEKTDIVFDYTAKKTGKKYTHLHFKIRSNSDIKSIKNQVGNKAITPKKIIMRLCDSYKLSVWQAKIIVQKVTIKEICKELYEIDLEKYSGKIRNIGGYSSKRFDQKYNLGLFSSKKV